MSDNNSNTINYAIELLKRPSVTPIDEGCQNFLADKLEPLGFKIEHMRFDNVDNLWARLGTEEPCFTFAGHTDVVPTGPLEEWDYPPFDATIKDGRLFARGSADMKGSIAAMLSAVEDYLGDGHKPKGSIAFLITSDEEGPSINGTVKVIEALEQRNEKITWCLVGEPSSTTEVGDVIKNGRRGSLGCKLTVIGKQGHIAYPHLANNPIHSCSTFISELTKIEWDQGNEYFPPTSFQVSNIHAGTGANNVIPGHIDLEFNFRYSSEVTHEELQEKVEALLKTLKIEYKANWNLSGKPFITPIGVLVNAASDAIKSVCSYETELSTSGGTSDGRFIAPTGAQVVELGPVNATIHQLNENVRVSELDTLTSIYKEMLINLLD